MDQLANRRLILLILLWLVWAKGWSQNPLDQVVPFDLPAQSIRESLSQLEQSGDFYFSYNPDLLNLEKRVALASRGMLLRLVLDELFGSGLLYLHRGSYLIIKARPNKESRPEKIHFAATGKVLDAKTGKVVPNVSVYDATKLQSTLSNELGEYDLQLSQEESYIELAISHQNYQDTLIRVSAIDFQDLQISLTPLPESKFVPSELAMDSAAIVSLFMGEQARWNQRNVSLTEVRLFQISLVPFVGSNGKLSGKVNNHATLNLLAGYSDGVSGVEIGGVLNLVRKDMIGMQIGGVGNVVGEEVKGLQIGGLFNSSRQQMRGTQIAGFLNLVKDTVSGLQISGAINQGKLVRGVQLSGLLNLARERTSGVQISGFLNYTKRLSGIQIGIINVADTVENGVNIGLFNFVRKGFHQLELVHDDVMHSQLYFKTGTHRFYTILGAGMKFRQNETLWSYSYGFGTQWKLGKKGKWYTGTEVRSTAVQLTETWISSLNQVNDVSQTLGYQLTPRLSVNAGPTLHLYLSSYLNPESGELGLDLATAPFLDLVSNETLVQMWVGYQLGFRF